MTPHKAGLSQALVSVFLGGVAVYRVRRFGVAPVLFFIALAAAFAALGYRRAYNREKNKPAPSDWNLERFQRNSRKRGW